MAQLALTYKRPGVQHEIETFREGARAEPARSRARAGISAMRMSAKGRFDPREALGVAGQTMDGEASLSLVFVKLRPRLQTGFDRCPPGG